MSKSSKSEIVVCEFYTWKLFARNGVYYADGRSAKTNLGKNSLGTRDKKEALANLHHLDRKMAVQFGLCEEPVTSKPLSTNLVTIVEGWKHYLTNVEQSEITGGAGPKTLKRYSAVRDKHVLYCENNGVMDWSAIDKKHIRAYGTYLKGQGYAARTIYLEMTTLKSVNKLLVQDQLIPATVRIHLAISRPQGSDTYCYTRQQVQSILAHCVSRGGLTWLRDFLHLLAASGLRAGEAVSLRRSDVLRDENGIPIFLALTDERASHKRKALGLDVRKTKGKRGRMVPIDSSLREVIERQPQSKDGLLFHDAVGNRLRVDRVRNVFIREVVKPLTTQYPMAHGEVGFEHGRLHGFRHFFVSQAFLNGANEGEIKDWVGHRDSRVVELYRHLGQDDSRRKFERLDILGFENGSDGLNQNTAKPKRG